MEWKEIKIKDLGIVLTGNTPPTSQREYYGDRYTFIKPTDMVENQRFVYKTGEKFSDLGYKKYKKYLLPTNTTVVVTIGTIGKLCLTKEPSFTNQATNAIIADKKQFDQRFIYYLMIYNNPQVKNLSSGTASGRENVSKSTFENIQVKVPISLPTQQKIASILSAYDDLIENNQQRIAILEQMAQNIYQEWFVRFRFPGHAQSEFVEGLPKGWKKVSIGDVCEVGRGSSPRPITDNKYFDQGTIPWIKIADATKSGRYLYKTKQYINEYGASFSRKLRRGDLIVSTSGTLGFCQILGVAGCIHDGWLYLSNYNNISPLFLYYVINQNTTYFENISYGAAIQNINTNILKSTPFILPDKKNHNMFINITKKLDTQIDLLERKNLLLQQQRDKLLPRLLSGKLEV